MVTTGRFRIVRDDKELGVLTPSKHMADTTLLKPRDARASLIADGRGTLLTLRRKAFWSLVKDRPWLGVNLLERLVGFLSEELDESVSRRDDGNAATSRLSIYQLV